MLNGWRYYNHALLPNCAPHECPDVSRISDNDFWSTSSGTVLLARWTSEFDCKDEQKWWYVIKDDVFDITALKSKRRYEITKGKKNYDVRIIDPNLYINDIISIHIEAYKEYPAHYRPTVDAEKLESEIKRWNVNYVTFGAFSKDTNQLCGFAMIIPEKQYANFAMLKVKPCCERKGINASIVAGVLEFYNEKINKGYYICDGERALFHETNFQDYLIKYFGFRKAYAKLHVKFRFPVSIIVWLLRPFKTAIKKKNSAIMKKIYVILLYDELSVHINYQGES